MRVKDLVNKVLFGIVAAATCALAGGNITGTIVDEGSGRPLTGASVEVGSLKVTTVTGSDGKFELIGLPAGNHEVEIRYVGYENHRAKVKVDDGSSAGLSAGLKSTVLDLDPLVVTGTALSGQARALNQQKHSRNIVQVVAADQIGRFPDANTGDAVKRLPGLNVEYDQGEARFLHIRGTDARLNSVTVNGERMASAESGARVVTLDLTPADLLSSIEVHKAITPDMDADAIGGSVNLVTRGASAKPSLSVTLGSGFNLLSESPTGLASFSASTRTLGGKLGVVVSGSYHNNPLGSDNAEYEWDRTDDGEAYLTTLEIRKYDVHRIRYGGTLGLDLNLGPAARIAYRGMVNLRDDFENRFRLVFSPGDGENDGVPGSDGLVRDAEVVRQLKGGGVDQNEARLERQAVISNSLSGSHTLSSVAKLDWTGAMSFATERRPNERYVEFAYGGVDLRPSISDLEKVNVSGDGINDPANFELDKFETSNQVVYEMDWNGKADATIPVVAWGNEIKTGVRVRSKVKDNDLDFMEHSPGQDYTLADFKTKDFSDDDFLAGEYRVGRFPTVDELSRFQSRYSTEGEEIPGEYLGGEYRAREVIWAGYLQSEQAITAKLSLLAGVRLEHTSLKYNGNSLLFDDEGDLTRVESTSRVGDYLNVLPGIHAKFAWSENGVLRAAYTQALARPNYYDLVPYRVELREDNALLEGNPELKPTVSQNVDLMAEHYFSSIGIVSGGLFYKWVDKFIYTQIAQNYTDPASGHAFDEYGQPQNGNGANIYGVEIAAQRQFDFLPGFWKHFGIYANYTVTYSEAFGIGEREELPLVGTSLHGGNLSLSYSTPRVEARLSGNYRSEALSEVGDSKFYDRYLDQSFNLDANVSYRFGRRFQYFLEVNNLTNQPLRYYQGDQERPMQVEYYNRRFTSGIRIDL